MAICNDGKCSNCNQHKQYGDHGVYVFCQFPEFDVNVHTMTYTVCSAYNEIGFADRWNENFFTFFTSKEKKNWENSFNFILCASHLLLFLPAAHFFIFSTFLCSKTIETTATIIPFEAQRIYSCWENYSRNFISRLVKLTDFFSCKHNWKTCKCVNGFSCMKLGLEQCLLSE